MDLTLSFHIRKTVPVLLPVITHHQSTWNAFERHYGVEVTGIISAERGSVVLVSAACLTREIFSLARDPVISAGNPLFFIIDPRPDEIAACGFFCMPHPQGPQEMHFIGKIPVAPAPPAQATCHERSEEERAAEKIGFWFIRLSRRRMARRMARELEKMRKQLSAETRAREQRIVRLKTAHAQIKQLNKEKKALNKTCKTTESDRDRLLVTLQNVLSERDEARAKRDEALEQAGEATKALVLVNAVPVATAVETDTSMAQKHRDAHVTLAKFRKYCNEAQLMSFLQAHNPVLKGQFISLKNENKRLEKQCRRLENEHDAKLTSLKKNLKVMEIQVKETKRFEINQRVVARLIVMTGAKNGKQLESILEPLYEIAQEFKDFGGRPPLAGFILWARSISDLIGKGRSHHWKVPKLFALYNELEKMQERHNTVDALHVFNVAMEQIGCRRLSDAAVKLAKPSLVMEVGRYDAALAGKPLPEVWSEETKSELYHFCMHHTCDFIGDNSLLEIMVSLQDTQPLNISRAASAIYVVLNHTLSMIQRSELSLPVNTHEFFLRCVFLKCQAGWQKRPYLMKCKSPSDAAIASRALCIRSCCHLGGIQIRNYPITVPALARMARCWPDYDTKDYELLLEYEGDFLTEKHLFTLAALADPLKNAAFPWCTLHAYMQIQKTEMLWEIVLSSQSMYDAKRILMRIVGNRYVTNDQIARFRQECHALKAFKMCYNEDDDEPQKILLKPDNLIEVIGPSWEKSVATQMGCPYPNVETTDDEYWNFIYQWIGKEKCDFQSDWHLSVGSSLTAEDLAGELAQVKTPPVSPQMKAATPAEQMNMVQVNKVRVSDSPRMKGASPAEHFMQTVDAGLRKAKEAGLMSKRDIQELQATADSLHAKIKFVDIGSGCKERKDSVSDAVQACNKAAGDAFLL